MSDQEKLRTDSKYNEKEHSIDKDALLIFEKYLREKEKSEATIEKYLRDVRIFCGWMDVRETEDDGNDRKEIRTVNGTISRTVNKETVLLYKKYMSEKYKLSSVNSKVSSLNAFFHSMGWGECCVSTCRMQRAVFRDPEKELTAEEYFRLVEAAKQKGDVQLALIMETLASTGIRISELSFITAEAVRSRHAFVSLKGKSRVVLLPAVLCEKLWIFCNRSCIVRGSVFITRKGLPMDRTNILHKMKKLSESANVPREKIFPHNLRHLFAVMYYQQEKDIVRLADLLGHGSINTTRIYTLVGAESQFDSIDRMGRLLVSPPASLS